MKVLAFKMKRGPYCMLNGIIAFLCLQFEEIVAYCS